MIGNYLAYDRQTMTVLYSHQKLSIITDLLHIEQKDNFSIVGLDSPNIFRKHTAQELKKLYLNLGGDASCFVQAATLYLIHEEIRQECIRLAILWPTVQCSGFELELQAAWVDGQINRSGYRYSAGCQIPVQV